MGVKMGPLLAFSKTDLGNLAAGSTNNDVTVGHPLAIVGSTGAAANFTSMNAPSAGNEGQLRVLIWNRSGDVVFKQDNGSLGTAANRIRNSGGFDVDMGASGRKGTLFWYDPFTLRWRTI